MLAVVCLWSWPAWACELGEVCWVDQSGGTADTELRFRGEGGEVSTLVAAGRQSYRFAELLRASPLFPSDWLCVQGRQRTAAGTYSDWYLSETEGVCQQMERVLPPDPPPVEPPPSEGFGAVTQNATRLSIDYAVRDCPRGVQQTTSATRDGRRTITLTCRK